MNESYNNLKRLEKEIFLLRTAYSLLTDVMNSGERIYPPVRERILTVIQKVEELRNENLKL